MRQVGPGESGFFFSLELVGTYRSFFFLLLSFVFSRSKAFEWFFFGPTCHWLRGSSGRRDGRDVDRDVDVDR